MIGEQLQMIGTVSKFALLAVGAIYTINRLVQWNRRCRSKNSLDGKIVVITGATAGMGKETAFILAKRGATLVLGCRDCNKGNDVALGIINSTGNCNISVRQLDISSFKSIGEFADELSEMYDHIDILINNAGVFYLPGDLKSDDGINLTMATNYFGPIYLTFRLIKLLKNARSAARVINNSSHGYTLAKKVDSSDFFDDGKVEKLQLYGKSKLALNLASIYLGELLDNYNISVNIMTPGDVYTGILDRYAKGFFFWPFLVVIRFLFFKTPKEGAQTIAHLALCEDLGSGKYFADCKENKLEDHSTNVDAMKTLWSSTVEVFCDKGVYKDFIQPHCTNDIY